MLRVGHARLVFDTRNESYTAHTEQEKKNHVQLYHILIGSLDRRIVGKQSALTNAQKVERKPECGSRDQALSLLSRYLLVCGLSAWTW